VAVLAVRALITKAGSTVAALALVACESGSEASTGSPDAAVQGCHPTPGRTALCLKFTPEAIAAETEPALDTNGFLQVEVFDGPTPSSRQLYRRTFPDDFANGGEIAIAELPEVSVDLADSPTAVFVRALFFDHAANGPDGEPRIDWGTWLGGDNLSYGIAGTSALSPVPLAEGQVTMHEVPLVALRRLTATVTASAKPLGDGEGALSVFASRIEELPPAAPTYGYGIDPCVDVNRGAHTVEMFLLGSGTFFVAASFEDLGIETPGRMPPGTLLSLHDFDSAANTGTFDRITVAEEQYAAAVLLDLASMSPFPGDPSVIGPNSCADLGLPGPP
jgi:hypothetical protein